VPWEHLPKANAIVAAVAHQELLDRPLDQVLHKLSTNGLYVDVKCRADAKALVEHGIQVWRL
jgi:UDP-N-acetyl-D-galactosamine dehydrogenase